jgi:hypothetical protein
MAGRKLLVFWILLSALISYTTYAYFSSRVFVSYQTSGDPSPKTEIDNPLSIIFTGRMWRGGNTYAEYDVFSRIMGLTHLLLWGGLVASTLRYYLSKGMRYRFMLFMLMLYSWTLIAYIVSSGFHRLWEWYYPNEPILYPGSSIWFVLFRNVTELVVICFIIRIFYSTRTDSEPSRPEHSLKPPLRWMRIFHFVTDRLIVFALAMNLFTTYYILSKYDTGSIMSKNLSPDNLYFWAVVTVAVSSAVCYFVTEKLFGVSPSKLLTDTCVTSVTGGRPTLAIFTRSLSRLIPLESLSFFSAQGWHDRFSGTEVCSQHPTSWLQQNSRIVEAVFKAGLGFFIFMLVCVMLQFIMDDFIARKILLLPMIIAPFAFLYMMVTFTCWIATVSNYAENCNTNQFTESSSHFFYAACMWMPIFNFTTNGTLFGNIASNLQGLTTDEQVEVRTNKLRRAFMIMYIFLMIFLVRIFHSTYWIEIYVLMAFASVGILVWILQVLRYTGSLVKLKSTP